MRGGRGRFLLLLSVAALLAGLVLGSKATAEHSVVELVSQTSAGPANGPFDVRFEGASEDGSTVFFSTEEALAPADTDQPDGCTDSSGAPANCRDVYARRAGFTILISRGPVGSPGGGAFDASFEGASKDGSVVFFSTDESLLPADADPPNGCTDSSGNPSNCRDVYMRSGTTTTLVSRGTAGRGNEAFDAAFEGASEDGSVVFFSTPEPLVAGDTDSCMDIFGSPIPCNDVYRYSNGATTRVSVGNGPFDASFDAASADGSRVYFSTRERLVIEDAETPNACKDTSQAPAPCRDIYMRTGTSPPTLMSVGPNSGDRQGDEDVSFDGISRDGSRVFFTTTESLTPSDQDSDEDVYTRKDGTSLISIGGNGDFDAKFEDASDDGTRVFFSTDEPLLPEEDTDCGTDTVNPSCEEDIYERRDVGTELAATVLISTPGGSGEHDADFEGASRDGTRVFFRTRDALFGADNDPPDGCTSSSGSPAPCRDIYERRGNLTTLISTGPAGGDGAFDASFEGASADGSRVFFATSEQLTRGDADPQNGCLDSTGTPDWCRDVYERAGFATTLISNVPGGGNGPFDASFEGASLDGTRVFFSTPEALLSADGDGADDLYMARPGADLSLSISDSADPLVIGDALTYTLSIRNHGSLDTDGVRVTSPLPAAATFQSATPSQGSCSTNAGTLTCELGALARGAAATVEVRVTPQNAGVLTYSASVVGTQTDPSAANNSETETTTVNPPAPPPPPPATASAPPPAAAPTAPAPRAVARDVTAPALAVFSRTKNKLESVLARGLRVTVRCLEACRIVIELEADRKTAKRLKLSASKTVVGRASARLTAGKSKRVTVKLTKKAKKRLGRRTRSRSGRRIKLKLRTTATDAAGNSRTVNGRVTLER